MQHWNRLTNTVINNKSKREVVKKIFEIIGGYDVDDRVQPYKPLDVKDKIDEDKLKKSDNDKSFVSEETFLKFKKGMSTLISI